MQSQAINTTKEKVTPDLAKRKKELTVTLHIGGKQVETLTTEQRNRIAERLSETMSVYYSLHSAEYRQIK